MTAPPHPPSFVDGLNAAQREAVEHVDGALLVVAGAGSGKTRVLTARIAQLIREHGVDPREILAVTFTNKAAGEMRERIARLLHGDPAGMWCGTFHAIGARILRAHPYRVGRTMRYTIYDQDDTLGVIKRLMDQAQISTKERSPQAIASTISDARNALISPQEFETTAYDPHSKAVAQVFKLMEPALRQANAVTFDDLLALPVEIIEQHAEVLDQLRDRFRYIMVDEYQDTNRAQYRFISLLGKEHGNVVVVGDDDQSIYGWRGADIRNILDFEKDFPDTKVVRLEDNYRSTPQVLALANAAISLNTERRGKTLRATRPSGEQITCVATVDERDEADYVVSDLQHRRFTRSDGVLRDFAVLYRTNAQSRSMEDALRRAGLPYRLIGATRFYDRREIRDLMAYLRLVANPQDDESFRRAIAIPRRGVGAASLEALSEAARTARCSMLAAAGDEEILGEFRPAVRKALSGFASTLTHLRQLAEDSSVDELLREIVARIGYTDALLAEGPEGQDRVDNVRELIAGAAELVIEEGGEVGLRPLDHFLQGATLVAATDALDPSADAVTLMTLHNAKGLEFPVVYLTGLEEGLFPLSRARDSIKELEEERRLFYVGITRAENVLCMTHARGRRRNGEYLQCMPSSFLKALPTDLYQAISSPRLRASGLTDALRHPRADRPAAVDQDLWGDEAFSSTARSAASRRPGVPVTRPLYTRQIEDESQDAPFFQIGERVVHQSFGDGTISNLSGSGRDAKVTIDFDDEAVGRKRLVLAFASLSRGIE